MNGRISRFATLSALCLLLTACGTPWSLNTNRVSREGITLVSGADNREAALDALVAGGEQPTAVHAGDVISIRRHYTTDNESITIRPDGTFAYPLAGQINASGKTPEAIADELETRLTGILRYPKFTVNIVESPGNRAFLGGEIKLPGFVSLRARMTLQQAIAANGGLLTTGDDASIAILRLNTENRYDLFLIDFQTAFEGSGNRPIWLRRDDMVYIAKSRVARAIDFIDLYFNRLIPFNKTMSFVVYDVNRNTSLTP